ncbi:hypothetical protein EVG20_g1129 [Dentipellis fragilis]|uniref:Ubiquitin-like domain-containing protein n=1 Tax=Dentipellis fragilis TaxID=205917 RepID=A0A4Y9ZD04_9AGAM|nr:hypothetical protein EVG20_g1129 [Dentipellis fragilis]
MIMIFSALCSLLDASASTSTSISTSLRSRDEFLLPHRDAYSASMKLPPSRLRALILPRPSRQRAVFTLTPVYGAPTTALATRPKEDTLNSRLIRIKATLSNPDTQASVSTGTDTPAPTPTDVRILPTTPLRMLRLKLLKTFKSPRGASAQVSVRMADGSLAPLGDPDGGEEGKEISWWLEDGAEIDPHDLMPASARIVWWDYSTSPPATELHVAPVGSRAHPPRPRRSTYCTSKPMSRLMMRHRDPATRIIARSKVQIATTVHLSSFRASLASGSS